MGDNTSCTTTTGSGSGTGTANNDDEDDVNGDRNSSSDVSCIFVRKGSVAAPCSCSSPTITPIPWTPVTERSWLLLGSASPNRSTAGSSSRVSRKSTQKRTNSTMTTATTTTSTTTTTLHAQVLLLALAFAAVWSSQNCMAPNLSQMATYFNLSPSQRDLYLGAHLAFATGVLSLPVSTSIGLVADVVPSRKTLYALTVFLAGVSSLTIATTSSSTSSTSSSTTTYTQLYISRFISGGCMAGSLPVAFSLIADYFDATERNAASSGLTVAMGLGILFGQLVAGMVGPTRGWQYPFTICGYTCILTAILVQLFVTDPQRGAKEGPLQELLQSGKSYDRKFTFQRFYHAATHQLSNTVILTQGFFTNIPWGIIFVFLNDYLSQECGLSIQKATYLLLLFGIGAALGGIVGGWIGSYLSTLHPSYLPYFMSLSTFFGIFPFWALLNYHKVRLNNNNNNNDAYTHQHHFVILPSTLLPYYAFLGGFIANLPTVNIRPALLSVNLPETRGAILTATNLLVSLARGIGPVMLTSTMTVFHWNRQTSFQVLLIFHWSVGAILLIFLAYTLPKDQQWVEQELKAYAEESMMVLGRMPSSASSSFSSPLWKRKQQQLLLMEQQQQQQQPLLLLQQHFNHTPFLHDSTDINPIIQSNTTTYNSDTSFSPFIQHKTSLFQKSHLQEAYYFDNIIENEDENQRQLHEEEEEEEDIASLVHSIDDPLMAFNADTARGSIRFLNEAIREIGDEFQREWNILIHCGANHRDDHDDDINNSEGNNDVNDDHDNNISYHIRHLQSNDSMESSSFPVDDSLSIPTL